MRLEAGGRLRRTKKTVAGRSASRLLYQGNQEAAVGKRPVRRFLVRALHETNGGAQGNETPEVLGRAVEVRLQAHADVRIGRPRATVKRERRVNVIAGFHVDPDDALRVSVFDDPRQV